MIGLLIVILAAVTWVYVIEALKQTPGVAWLHYRSRGRLWLLAVVGALLIALIVPVDAPWWLVAWAALGVEQLTYDGIVHRRVPYGLR